MEAMTLTPPTPSASHRTQQPLRSGTASPLADMSLPAGPWATAARPRVLPTIPAARRPPALTNKPTASVRTLGRSTAGRSEESRDEPGPWSGTEPVGSSRSARPSHTPSARSPRTWGRSRSTRPRHRPCGPAGTRPVRGRASKSEPG